MTDLFFVDANVVVYARDASNPLKQSQATEWLQRLWRDQTGRTSIQVLSEYYVTVTRKMKPGLPRDDAWEDVCALFSWRPQAVDEALLRRGREIQERYGIAWWDSLIVGAAQLQGCSMVLSEDLQDGGVYGGVTVRSPFTLAVNEPLPSYVPARSVASPPRGRGRPKKSTSLRTST